EQDKLVKLQKELAENQDSSLIKEEVTREDIAEVVGKWTGIPVTKMLQSDREKLLNLEDELHNRVVGQDEAISAVADAVRRSRAGLHDVKKPLGTFLFLGTTGVGKTELAKALAEYLFDTENSITRIDMSEYQERHAVSRLVGAPPGYVGYEEGGQLTEAVRRKPYSVILLDEIEKAHPDTFNILLQVLDEGRLTDNKGRVADFKNTIIIMTSNMGSTIIQERFEKMDMNRRDLITEATKAEVLVLLKETIRPEFLNRIDEIIMFTPLNESEIKQIVKIQLDTLAKMLLTKDIHIDFSEEVIQALAKKGYDPQFGARPVKRVIQKEVLNELSKEILSGKVTSESHILLDAFDDKIVFRNKK
ncbi:MAG: AAA family ATPase, partial [Lutibacter sp.]|nr:AAA family ATPase [Lutibacter sp.]